jgi:hypothetical protein
MAGGDRGRPSEDAFGAKGKSYAYLHGPQILTHGFSFCLPCFWLLPVPLTPRKSEVSNGCKDTCVTNV